MVHVRLVFSPSNSSPALVYALSARWQIGRCRVGLERLVAADNFDEQHERQGGGHEALRNVLQPKAQACEKRDAVACRVRAAANDETRRCLRNSGLFNALDAPFCQYKLAACQHPDLPRRAPPTHAVADHD